MDAKNTLATALRVSPDQLVGLETCSTDEIIQLATAINRATEQREQQLREALANAGKFIPGPLLRTIKKRFFR